jgi:ABC-2 type transport system ATP-binding protein
MAERAIDVVDLCKNYGPVKAIDRVTFHVAPGELVGFLGPNGAGKSTTMRVLATVMPASSGEARILGRDVMSESRVVRTQLGFLPESVPLYGEMRVEEYLHYRARLKGVDRAKRQARIDYCLDKCRVKEVRRRLVGTLSKGYRQRVGLADALINDPAVLILDEPTSGLDPVQIRETLNAIRELAGSHTVMLSTHILSEVEAVCDRVIIINRGTLRWDGKLSDLAAEAPKLRVDIRGPYDDVAKFLRGTPGVQNVTGDPLAEIGEFELTVHKDFDIEKSIVRPIVDKGWGLRRLDPHRRGLDDLYMDVVMRTA